MTDPIKNMQELVKSAGPEAAIHFREELEHEIAQEARNRLHLLLDVLQYTRENNPGYFTDAEHFAIHMERVAWFRVQEALDAAIANRNLYNPRKNVPGAEDIQLQRRVSAGLEKKVQHIAEWLRIKDIDVNINP